MAQMKIFVSHSHRNNAFCKKLVKALKDAGADVWYDDESLQSGRLGPIIERELRERPVFIVVLSPAALASSWVEDETRWAYNRLRRDPTRIMLPVLTEEIPDEDAIWLFLQDFKRIGATGSKPLPPAQAIEKTLRALALTPPGAAPTPSTPRITESVDDLIVHGKVLLAQEKFAEALPFFERATQRDSRSFDAWVNLGYVSGKLSRHDEALAAFDRALELDTTDAPVWVFKGSALIALGRYDEALAAFDRALALDPDSALAWNGKCISLVGTRRYGKALAACDRALALDPLYAPAWAVKGLALRGLGRVTEAEAAELRARELGCKEDEVYQVGSDAHAGAPSAAVASGGVC